LEDALTIQTFG